MSAKNNAPAGNEGAATGLVNHDQYSHDQADVRAAVTGYALAVETGSGRYRRRLFLTLSAAENAVRRARERGQYAEVILVRVVPVEVVE